MSAATTPNLDPQRVERYVEGYFQRSGRTDWPTVRQVARAVKLRQREVEMAVEDHPAGNLMLTMYNVEGGTPLGEQFVETYSPPEVSR